jgi:hypothetical protein
MITMVRVFSLLTVLCLLAQPASAQNKEPAFQGLIPPSASISYGGAPVQGGDTHPKLALTPDKSELVRLDQDAGSIIVGNPDHLGVLMDNRRLLILVPRVPGATYLTVLDRQGQVIMQRPVIVASPKQNYVRIRRSCTGGDKDCNPTSVYFCPGMCHPVGLVQPQDGTAAIPAAPVGGSFGGTSVRDTSTNAAPAEAESGADMESDFDGNSGENALPPDVDSE